MYKEHVKCTNVNLLPVIAVFFYSGPYLRGKLLATEIFKKDAEIFKKEMVITTFVRDFKYVLNIITLNTIITGLLFNDAIRKMF